MDCSFDTFARALLLVAIAINVAVLAVNYAGIRRLRAANRVLAIWIKVLERMAQWHANQS
jgi:hypothetical protein